MLNAEAARVRAVNEELIAEIAAEEEKTKFLSTTAENFAFENPMSRLGRSPKTPASKNGLIPINTPRNGEDKNQSPWSGTNPMILMNAKRQAEAKLKLEEISAETKAVLDENENKSKDLIAAKSQRDLLIHAIAAEEEMALTLQDRAAEIMTERSLRSSIAVEESKALSLLSGATISSRDRFQAATAMFETEKLRAEAAEESRLEMSAALVIARERNAQLLASLTAEEARTLELQVANMEAIKERTSITAMSEMTSKRLTAALNDTRAEIAEKERQLEIQGMKARRLTASIRDNDDAISVVSESISPTSSSPKRPASERAWMPRRSEKEKASLEDFRDDSDSENSCKTPNGGDDIPSSNLLRKLFKPTSINTNATTIPGREMLKSPVRSPVNQRSSSMKMDFVPNMKNNFKVNKDEPKGATAMENEAKMIAEKIRNKRDAIRTAVDGILNSPRVVTPRAVLTPLSMLSCDTSISSDQDGTATENITGCNSRAEKSDGLDDDDENTFPMSRLDHSIPFKLTSHSLVSSPLVVPIVLHAIICIKFTTLTHPQYHPI